MRIALWSTGYFKGFGGAEKVVNDILNHLDLPDAQLFLIGDQAKHNPAGNEFFSPLPAKVYIYQNTFPNPLLSKSNPLVFIWKILLYLKASIQLAYFLRRHKVQIIHLHLVNIDVLLLIFYKLIFSYKLILTFAGMELLLARNSAISRFKLRMALKYADRVTVVSKEIGKSLEKNYHFSQSIYIPNGIEEESGPEINGTIQKKIRKGSYLFCGRLHPVKRLPFLIEAFRAALDQGLDNYLYIAGDGTEKERIHKLIKKYQLQKRVVLTGSLRHEEVIKAMGDCKALLLSSRSEGCPMVVLEAMSMGKTVVASNVGDLSNIISHNVDGLLYPAHRRDLLTKAILQIENSPAQATEMGRNAAQKIAEHFSLRNMVGKYEGIYQELSDNQTNK